MTEPAEIPAEFAGCIGIEWPAILEQGSAPGKAIPGWAVSLYDDEGPVTTVIAFTVHAAAASVVWATLWMYATKDGKPLLHPAEGLSAGSVTIPTGDDDEPVIGAFAFLVTSMRVKGNTA